jgi:tetratricopeptide (TPR) repeat protein
MDPSTAIAVAGFNNEGVILIESGLYNEAITEFSKGLTMVQQVLALQGNDSITEPASHSSSCHFHFKMQEPKATNELVGQEEVLGNEPFIFRAPLYIESRATDHTSFTHYVKSSFMLLYNLALTHHLSALSGDNTQKRLQKALKLYELAYTIQLTEDIQLSILQTMAIVNNLGQIHTALQDEEKARMCFKHLLSSIMFVHDYGDRGSLEQMDGFIANVMPLILLGSSSPAAAA